MIAYDNSTAASGVANLTLTMAHTTGSGSNRILFVGVTTYTNNTDAVSSVTYAGTAMTRVNTRAGTGGFRQYLYYQANPSSGANNVVVTVTSSRTTQVSAASYSGASQTGIPDSQNTAGVTGAASITGSTTVVGTNCWLVATFVNDTSDALVAGANTTKRGTVAAHCITDSNGVVLAGSRSQTISWTGNGEGMCCIASFAPATAAANHFLSLLGVGA